jgi:hypothetical protein
MFDFALCTVNRRKTDAFVVRPAPRTWSLDWAFVCTSAVCYPSLFRRLLGTSTVRTEVVTGNVNGSQPFIAVDLSGFDRPACETNDDFDRNDENAPLIPVEQPSAAAFR